MFCLNLAQRDEPVMARDLDLSRCVEPYAYPFAQANADYTPPLIAQAILLKDKLPIKLSSDLAAFAAHLMADQPWLPDQITQETLAAIQCQAQTASAGQAAGLGAPATRNRPGVFSRWRIK